MYFLLDGSGNSAGFDTNTSFPSFVTHLYTTVGAVTIKSKSYSLSNLSFSFNFKFKLI